MVQIEKRFQEAKARLYAERRRLIKYLIAITLAGVVVWVLASAPFQGYLGELLRNLNATLGPALLIILSGIFGVWQMLLRVRARQEDLKIRQEEREARAEHRVEEARLEAARVAAEAKWAAEHAALEAKREAARLAREDRDRIDQVLERNELLIEQMSQRLLAMQMENAELKQRVAQLERAEIENESLKRRVAELEKELNEVKRLNGASGHV